jgi:hypothetical protein
VIGVPTAAHGQEARSPVPSAADLESARALVREGRELRASGDLGGALDKFRAAHALGRTAVTGIELARAHEALSEWVEAREVALSVARLPVASDETERSAAARADAAALAESLRDRIPSIRVIVEGAPATGQVQIFIDGTLVPREAADQPRKVNPKSHRIAARVGGREVASATVAPGEAETRDVTLVIPPSALADLAPAPAPTVEIDPASGAVGGAPARALSPSVADGGPASTQKSRGLSPIAVGGIAVGSVALVEAIVAAAVAASLRSDLEPICPNRQCPPGAQPKLDDAYAAATAADVGFVIAGAAAMVAVLGLTVWAPKGTSSAVALQRGPLGTSVGVRF